MKTDIDADKIIHETKKQFTKDIYPEIEESMIEYIEKSGLEKGQHRIVLAMNMRREVRALEKKIKSAREKGDIQKVNFLTVHIQDKNYSLNLALLRREDEQKEKRKQAKNKGSL